MRKMSLAATKAHLSAVVDEVVAGEEVVITRRGQPVARITAEGLNPPVDANVLADELRAFVMAQPRRKGNSVVAMRAAGPAAGCAHHAVACELLSPHR